MALNVDLWMIVAYGANNTYKALRVIGENYNLYYSVWCTNEHELYDLSVRLSLLLSSLI
jgi:N-acetylglucosamine-6-sulfatase